MIESHRSQIVVAPASTGYNHDGHSSCSSNPYAAARCPVAVSASQINGVPTKPVAIV